MRAKHNRPTVGMFLTRHTGESTDWRKAIIGFIENKKEIVYEFTESTTAGMAEPDNEEESSSFSSFTGFPKLPLELQRKIRDHNFPGPRVLEVPFEHDSPGG